MPDQTTANVEAVAQRLYRQERARDGFEREFGEWERAGSLQDRFRADARDLLSVLDESRCRHGIAPTDLCLHADSIANQTTEQPETLTNRIQSLVTTYRERATALRNRKSASAYDAGQDEYEWEQDAKIVDGIADDIESLLKP